jgi:pimeloyl-ACP methyl ester carboxylesterase
MVGWHRLQVKISRYLAEEGFNVLRYDDSGIGNSEGDIDEESIVKIFSDIETGLFVPNAESAADFLASIFSKDKIIYLGFCGGGLTAVHSAAKKKDIAGVVDIGGPITLSSKEYLEGKDPWEIKSNILRYRSNIFRINPWIRFLTGKGEYKTILTSIVNYLKHKYSGAYRKKIGPQQTELPKNFNWSFVRSFEKYMRSRRPILLYFAEIDSATWELKKYFKDRYIDSNENSPFINYIEVEKANHIFSGDDHQAKMKEDISQWLMQFTR